MGDVADYILDNIPNNSNIIDRCCCKCKNHFEGTMDDDYCLNCYGELFPSPF